MFDNNWLLEKILIIPAILIGLTFHEYAHAWVAYKLGDDTPKYQGKLKLNPFVHIDILGFIMIILIGFGWGKPVETNPANFKNGVKDDLKVSIAGPLANLMIAFISAFILLAFYKYGATALSKVPYLHSVIITIFMKIVSINCMLFVFNLIPIPGLDGFHVLRDLFPATFYKISGTIYKYQLIILFIFIATPLVNYVVGIPSIFLYNGLLKIAGSII